MTSLQKQLASLAESTVNVTHLRKASILFNEKEATSLPTETILSIGLNGLLELIKKEPRFLPFEKTLFDKSSVQFNRQLHTKEENKKLDESIGKFLTLLSPFLLLKPAQKAFEYLLRRYK